MIDKCILVVDDELGIREILKEFLEQEFKRVILAQNGEEALQIFKNDSNIDIVLSDLSMPKMNGVELLKEIRKFNSKVPFVFFSGFGSDENMKLALRYGAYDFVNKPVNDVNDIVIILKKALTQTSTEKNDDASISEEFFNIMSKIKD